MASQLLERKSPKNKMIERPQAPPPPPTSNAMVNGHGNYPPMMAAHNMSAQQPKSEMPLRPPMFQHPKPPGINQVGKLELVVIYPNL